MRLPPCGNACSCSTTASCTPNRYTRTTPTHLVQHEAAALQGQQHAGLATRHQRPRLDVRLAPFDVPACARAFSSLFGRTVAWLKGEERLRAALVMQDGWQPGSACTLWPRNMHQRRFASHRKWRRVTRSALSRSCFHCSCTWCRRSVSPPSACCSPAAAASTGWLLLLLASVLLP